MRIAEAIHSFPASHGQLPCFPFMNGFCVLQKRTVKFLAINILVWIAVGFATVRAQTVALSPGVEDVGKLAAAKVNDDVILAFVRNSRTPIQLTSDDIIYLNTKGVSSSVMAALLQSPGIGVSTTAPTFPPASTNMAPPQRRSIIHLLPAPR